MRRGYIIWNDSSINFPNKIGVFLLMYIFGGIQANSIFVIFDYYLYCNILLLLAAFLAIEYDWKYIRWYCFWIGAILDAFTFQSFGASICAVWAMGYMIERIKRSFYIEYISTTIFLLFILILGYCFLYTVWQYVVYNADEMVAPFTLLVIQNAPLTLFCAPVLYPLLRVVFNVKKSSF